MFERDLVILAEALNAARDPWWIIGGAAMALHGLSDGVVKDIDVILSEADARRLMQAQGLVNRADRGSHLFRSEIFLQPAWCSRPVELMANLYTLTASGWTAVRPQTCVSVEVAGSSVFTPDLAELAAIFRMFDRPRDRDRAAMITAFLSAG